MPFNKEEKREWRRRPEVKKRQRDLQMAFHQRAGFVHSLPASAAKSLNIKKTDCPKSVFAKIARWERQREDERQRSLVRATLIGVNFHPVPMVLCDTCGSPYQDMDPKQTATHCKRTECIAERNKIRQDKRAITRVRHDRFDYSVDLDDRACDACGRSFSPRRSDQLRCTVCYQSHRKRVTSGPRRTPATECKTCGDPIKQSVKGDVMYCSSQCRREANNELKRRRRRPATT